MRSILLAMLTLSIGSLAQAGPAVRDGRPSPAREHAEVRRVDPDLGPLAPATGARADDLLSLPVTLSLPRLLTGFPGPAPAAACDLRLREQPPESLVLRIPVSNVFTVYLSADLEAELPRLDCVDGETYFSTGVEARITRSLTAFVEDFQPASMVLGADPEEPAVARSWDGHQIAFGLRWVVSERVTAEAACVVYALSVSRRDEALGATAAITWSF